MIWMAQPQNSDITKLPNMWNNKNLHLLVWVKNGLASLSDNLFLTIQACLPKIYANE